MNNLFKIIFGKSNKHKKNIPPDNTKLFKLLDHYIKNKTDENYARVAAELTNGNAYLILATNNDIVGEFPAWTPATEGYKIKWEGYFVDGMPATPAFTSKDALIACIQKPSQYVALSAKTILKMCKQNGIKIIIIDRDLPTMIVLQLRNKK